MQNNLLFSLILNISLLVLMATVLTELRPLRLMIKRQERSVYNQLFLGLIFGLLSISCTYTGLSFEGAVVNTRVVSTLAAGLVGGPYERRVRGADERYSPLLLQSRGFYLVRLRYRHVWLRRVRCGELPPLRPPRAAHARPNSADRRCRAHAGGAHSLLSKPFFAALAL